MAEELAKARYQNSSHWEYWGMRERALLVGGEIDIRGATGKGTVVTVRVPLSIDVQMMRCVPGLGQM